MTYLYRSIINNFNDVRQYLLPGFSEGDYVKCIYCGIKFKQFRSCQIHLEKVHRNPQPAASRTDLDSQVEPTAELLASSQTPLPIMAPEESASSTPPSLVAVSPAQAATNGGALLTPARPLVLNSFTSVAAPGQLAGAIRARRPDGTYIWLAQ